MPSELKVTRTVPVASEVDVIVAGGGIAGVAAALAAAREGARVTIADRFGALGGNMGPGMFSGGWLHLALDQPLAMPDRLKGIPGEIINRLEGCTGRHLGDNYFKDHQAVAYVMFKMMEENNVEVMLNTYAADPIVEDGAVTGLIVENRSGAQAVRAKVVIDCTGNADIAARAGCPMDEGQRSAHPGMYFAIGNVDTKAHEKWVEDNPASDDVVAWAEEIGAALKAPRISMLKPYYGLYRRAWHLGEYHFVKVVDGIGSITADHGMYRPFDGVVGAQLGVRGHDIRTGDAALMTKLEIACRVYIYETAQFFRRHVPGFENSYLFAVSPYFHSRGGRSVLCEYVITPEDPKKRRRHDDVVFVTYAPDRSGGSPKGYDFPYRQLVPKKIKGLLAAGRSPIVQPPSNRNRGKCLHMGQAAGVAAALAARTGVPPASIAVKELQRALHFKYHAPLGDEKRLQRIGLLPKDRAPRKRRPKARPAGTQGSFGPRR